MKPHSHDGGLVGSDDLPTFKVTYISDFLGSKCYYVIGVCREGMDLMGFFEGLYTVIRKLAAGDTTRKMMVGRLLALFKSAPFSMLSSDFASVGFFFCGGRGSVWSTMGVVSLEEWDR